MIAPEKERYTATDCSQTGYAMSIADAVVVLSPKVLPPEHPGQLFYCTGGNGSLPNPIGRSAFMVSLSTGEHCRWWRSDVIGILKPELLPDSARLHLSQIRPVGALDLKSHAPEFSGYCFLEDGRYSSGVWLCSPKEVMDYVEMQKPYQHRIMICDREDFCVYEMVDGQLVYPTQEVLDAFLSQRKEPEQTGGINMT